MTIQKIRFYLYGIMYKIFQIAVGNFLSKTTVMGIVYFSMFQEYFLPLLQLERSKFILEQHGALAHWSAYHPMYNILLLRWIVVFYLPQTKHRYIDHHHCWMISCAIFCWKFLKNCVYASSSVTTMIDLKVIITTVITNLDTHVLQVITRNLVCAW